MQHSENTCFCFMGQKTSQRWCSIVRIHVSVSTDKKYPWYVAGIIQISVQWDKKCSFYVAALWEYILLFNETKHVPEMLQHGKNTCFCFIEQNLSLIRCSILRICFSVLLDKNVPDMLEHSENTCFMFLLYFTKISPISCICTFCWTITVSILYCSMYNEITKFCSIGHKTHGVLQHREDIYLCLMG